MWEDVPNENNKYKILKILGLNKKKYFEKIRAVCINKDNGTIEICTGFCDMRTPGYEELNDKMENHPNWIISFTECDMGSKVFQVDKRKLAEALKEEENGK
jgi:hypothetical protein